MDASEVKKCIEAGIPAAMATVTADGTKFNAVVVSPAFEGKTMIAEHKMVYATVEQHIKSGAVHALNIKTYTPQEWDIVNA